MFKNLLLTSLFALIGLTVSAQLYPTSTSSSPISHKVFDEVLRTYVSDDGYVNYSALKANRGKLDQYTTTISNTKVNPNWSKNEKLAFWINAYNAFTLQIVIDNYPTNGIMAIKRGVPGVNSVWDKKFIPIGDNLISLGQIEHKIIRKELNEPKIHFAVNCASISCPSLYNRAFSADKLNSQLIARAKVFFYDQTKNKIENNTLYLSKLFKWYKEDFGDNEQGVVVYLNQYLDEKIPTGIDIKLMSYNWKLNDVLNR